MPFLGDEGTDLVIEVTEDGVPLPLPVDATLQIRVRRPSGAVVVLAATFVEDSDTTIHATADMDEAGVWQMQPVVTTGDGGPFTGDAKTFTVKPILVA